jgi:hypothetical protein
MRHSTHSFGWRSRKRQSDEPLRPAKSRLNEETFTELLVLIERVVRLILEEMDHETASLRRRGDGPDGSHCRRVPNAEHGAKPERSGTAAKPTSQ